MAQDFTYNTPPAKADNLSRFDPLPSEVEGILELNPTNFTVQGLNNSKLIEKVQKFIYASRLLQCKDWL